MKLLFLQLLVLVLTACIFLPEERNNDAAEDDCHMNMPQWTLRSEDLRDLTMCQGSGQGAVNCLLMIGIVVPVGTFVVSGSLVVVGNTLHWLEYQGRCKKSFINQQRAVLRSGLGN